jgi:hypothetical protein
MVMPYGGPLSQIGSMQGRAAELHLGSLKYIENQGGQSSRPSNDTTILAVPVETRDKPQAKTIRVDYTTSPGINTYGMDPMVSKASVIHELAYGRIDANIPKTGKGTGYPIPGDYGNHNLDLIV